MYTLTFEQADLVSGGDIFDNILKASGLFDLAESAYQDLKRAYEINRAAYGDDVANELLAAGGLGA
jgi:hypothetical protein